jgi:hypothetical protein
MHKNIQTQARNKLQGKDFIPCVKGGSWILMKHIAKLNCNRVLNIFSWDANDVYIFAIYNADL